MSNEMRKIQTPGIHHITNIGADRHTSIDFRDPLGLRIELASYRFEPPEGCRHAEVMIEADRRRVARGDHHIDKEHLADAIELLVPRQQQTLSDDRSAKNPYARTHAEPVQRQTRGISSGARPRPAGRAPHRRHVKIPSIGSLPL